MESTLIAARISDPGSNRRRTPFTSQGRHSTGGRQHTRGAKVSCADRGPGWGRAVGAFAGATVSGAMLLLLLWCCRRKVAVSLGDGRTDTVRVNIFRVIMQSILPLLGPRKGGTGGNVERGRVDRASLAFGMVVDLFSRDYRRYQKLSFSAALRL